jgi:uncharacterized protein YqjF (DUF2071 family)
VIWHQSWRTVLFLHFTVDQRQLALLMPRSLELDLFAGQAWLSYIVFRLQLRPAWLPLMPGFSSLLELNVRTYARYRGQSGIYFLRMYADNPLAIAASRWLTPLRYERARMIDLAATGGRHVECRPTELSGAALSLDFEMPGSFNLPPANSLDAWLVERYRLFVPTSDGRILTAVVQHAPWMAANVQLTQFGDTLSRAHGVPLPTAPALVHCSPGVAAKFNAFQVASDKTGADDKPPGDSGFRSLPRIGSRPALAVPPQR